MKKSAKSQGEAGEFSCHVCATYTGEVAKALNELVNKRRIFSSYSAAVRQAVLDHYRRLVREELELSRLSRISKQADEQV
jgi:Arc/MetJ-type ribon-helix-helix transcriptional regulator